MISPHQKPEAQSSDQGPTAEPLRPAPEVIAAWEKAGAEFRPGWRDVPHFRFGLFPTEKLNGLPSPEVPFGLHFRSVTDAGLKELASLTQLRALHLGGTQVTDAGLKELASLTQLRMLDLGGTQVTDAGLKELASLTQLQALRLNSTKVTDAGVQELRKALPKARIYH